VTDDPRPPAPAATDATHALALRSWVDSANDPASDFPIQNLPFGVFRHDFEERPRIGIAIGDHVLDCLAASRSGWFDGVDPAVRAALEHWSLNALMALGRRDARAVRAIASQLLRADTDDGRRAALARDALLVPMSRIGMVLPAEIGDYTDFYSSVHHATNVGALFRPDQPLLPNYKYVPIGYHGRASSVVVSGASVRRPLGQVRPDPTAPPYVAPTARLDYELELAGWIGGENRLGAPVPIADAGERLFGVSLLNDWSARDVQAWEYQPLGPFLAKNFATTVGAWVVTTDALAPFRTAPEPRADGDPAPLPYLSSAADQAWGALDVTLEVWLTTAEMRAHGAPAVRLSHGSSRSLYWTFAQLITHHASNGCNLRPGDLLGTGTISGRASESRGCLLELTTGGRDPVVLPGGATRTFLRDGDEIAIRGWCARDGAARIGFGECRGTIAAAPITG
jgi:fumarylacetoacetase